MKRNWTTVSLEYTSTQEQRDTLDLIFKGLIWEEIIPGKLIPYAPGTAIREAIRGFKLPNPTHYAISYELSPLTLIAVRSHYKNGRCDLYCLLKGNSCLVPLCSDIHPNAPSEVSK